MVFEKAKEKAVEYLKTKGLTTDDMGRVIGIFFFAKYIAFISMLPLCYKFQPIRRFWKPVGMGGAGGKDYFIHRRNKFQQSRVAASIAARTKGYREWLKRNEGTISEQKSKFQTNVLNVKKRVTHLLQQQREDQRRKLREKLTSGVDEKSWSVRIFRWTERVADKAAANEKWQTVAKSFKVPPKEFAYAIGEGLVFYKLTSPIWMPIELLCIVRYLQWRRRRINESESATSQKPT